MRLLRNLFLLLFTLLVLGLGAMFAVENTSAVPLNLLLFSLDERSVALWILLAFSLGGVLGMLANIGLVWRLRARLMRANRQVTRAAKTTAPTPAPAPVLSKSKQVAA